MKVSWFQMNIKFFVRENLESFNSSPGFQFGSRSTSKCNEFVKPVGRKLNGVRSIKTKACIMLYLTSDCTGRSIKIEAPSSANLTSLWESTVNGELSL